MAPRDSKKGSGAKKQCGRRQCVVIRTVALWRMARFAYIHKRSLRQTYCLRLKFND